MTYLPVSDGDFLLLRLKFHRNQSANWVSQPRHPHTKETALGDVGNWCSDCNKELRSQRQDLPSRGDGEGLVLSQNRQVQTRPLWTSGILWSIKTARVLLILNKSTVQNQSTTGTMMLRERTSMILPFNYMTLFAIHIPPSPPLEGDHQWSWNHKEGLPALCWPLIHPLYSFTPALILSGQM